MARPALTITASNQPDPRVVAEAAVALILDFHAKTSRPVLSLVEGSQRDLDRAGSIRYRIAQQSGVKLASPRVCSDNPTLRGTVPFQAPRNRKAA